MAPSPPRRHGRTLRSVRVVAVTATAAAVLFVAPTAGASGILPGANPRANVAPDPNFMSTGSCAQVAGGWSCTNPCADGEGEFPAFTNSASCTSYVLEAINVARKDEHAPAMRLPSNWLKLDPAEQLFVLADLERVGRGLPPYLGLNSALSAEAQRAAANDSDPTLAPGFDVGVDAQGYEGIGGTWATGYSTLVADYFWMYADGWGGSRAKTTNVACTSRHAAGCWAHRDELLGYDPGFNPGVGLHCRTCEMGTGYSMSDGLASMTDLIELPAGKPPAMTFTWAQDVLPYLAKAHESTDAAVVPKRVVARASWSSWGSAAGACLPLARSFVGRTGCHLDLQKGRHLVGPSQWEER